MKKGEKAIEAKKMMDKTHSPDEYSHDRAMMKKKVMAKMKARRMMA